MSIARYGNLLIIIYRIQLFFYHEPELPERGVSEREHVTEIYFKGNLTLYITMQSRRGVHNMPHTKWI